MPIFCRAFLNDCLSRTVISTAVNIHLSAAWFFQQIYSAQQRAFACSACADDAEYISFVDLKRNIPYGIDRGFFCIKSNGYIFKLIIIIENSVRQGGYPSYRLYTYLPCFFLSH